MNCNNDLIQGPSNSKILIKWKYPPMSLKFVLHVIFMFPPQKAYQRLKPISADQSLSHFLLSCVLSKPVLFFIGKDKSCHSLWFILLNRECAKMTCSQLSNPIEWKSASNMTFHEVFFVESLPMIIAVRKMLLRSPAKQISRNLIPSFCHFVLFNCPVVSSNFSHTVTWQYSCHALCKTLKIF